MHPLTPPPPGHTPNANIQIYTYTHKINTHVNTTTAEEHARTRMHTEVHMRTHARMLERKHVRIG